MSNCCGGVCGSFGTQFDAARAEGDARQYRTKGPNATTRQLRDGVILAGAGQTLLDIGAGIGAASIELLAAGFATAFTSNVQIPEPRGEPSRWVLVTGQVTMGKAVLHVGMALYAEEETTLRSLAVNGEKWLGVLGVKETPQPAGAR